MGRKCADSHISCAMLVLLLASTLGRHVSSVILAEESFLHLYSHA